MSRRIGRGNRIVDVLWRAQEARCFHCGERMIHNMGAMTERWTREHLHPRSRGGNGPGALVVLAHGRCNGERRDRLPTVSELHRAMMLYGQIGLVFDFSLVALAEAA